jgi:hypothetical protein
VTQEVVWRRFTVHDYHLMGEAGILHEDYRVDLIEGEIVEMAALGTRHFACVNQLSRLLVRSVGDVAIVSAQNPARLRRAHRAATRPHCAPAQRLQRIAALA